MAEVNGKRVAILATDGFEQSELQEPRRALERAGAEVDIVSIKDGPIKSWKDGNWSNEIDVDQHVARANPNDYDALVLPGGVISPDKLRVDEDAIRFVRAFFESGKPVAAICHGPWTLIEAGVVKGRRMTSYKSIKTDLINAGADWQDAEVVVDGGLVTSRHPGDLQAFCDKLLEEISEGAHRDQAQKSHASLG